MKPSHLALGLAFVVAGCSPAPDRAPEDTERIAESVVGSSVPKNPIEPSRDAPGVFKMQGAYLSRLPVSWFYQGSVTRTGAHHLAVRTECSEPDAELRDSGLYVVRKHQQGQFGTVISDAKFNDDCGGSATCSCATCSKVDMGAQSTTQVYDVYAFSTGRTKANCAVKLSSTGDLAGAYTTTLLATTPLGGALVDVGVVRRASDELFEVRTLQNEGTPPEIPQADTRMLLFDAGAATVASTATYSSTTVPVLADDQSNGDLDPKIGPNIPNGVVTPVVCASPPCAEPRSFLLLGMTNEAPPVVGSTGQIEATVSIVRGPMDVPGNSSGTTDLPMPPVPAAQPYTFTCGTPVVLDAGRHAASIEARSTAPYGEGDPASGDAGVACELMGYACDGAGNCGSCDSAYFYRGHGNFRGFKMRVEVQAGNGAWKALPTRDVPNGVFGCGSTAGGCWQTLSEDFELFVASAVRLCVADRDPRVDVGASWHVVRNPGYSELKVATLNVHNGDGSGIETHDEYRNMANVLATRGRLSPTRKSMCRHRRRGIPLPPKSPTPWRPPVVA